MATTAKTAFFKKKKKSDYKKKLKTAQSNANTL